jgi:hypothetical protein
VWGGVRRRGAQQQQREQWRGAQPAAVRGSEVCGEAGRAERRQRVEWRWEEQRGGARLAEEQPDREEAEAHGHQPQARRAQHAEPQPAPLRDDVHAVHAVEALLVRAQAQLQLQAAAEHRGALQRRAPRRVGGRLEPAVQPPPRRVRLRHRHAQHAAPPLRVLGGRLAPPLRHRLGRLHAMAPHRRAAKPCTRAAPPARLGLRSLAVDVRGGERCRSARGVQQDVPLLPLPRAAAGRRRCGLVALVHLGGVTTR